MSSIRFASVVTSVASALVATSATTAAIIDFTVTGVASGEWKSGIYQGQTFSNKAFTLTARALTENVNPFPGNSSIVLNDSAGLALEGYGDVSVTSTTTNFVSRDQSAGGMGVGLTGLFSGLPNDAFANWYMQTSLGPVTGTVTWTPNDLGTSLGNVRFSGTSVISYTAIVAPAPGAIALVGLAGLAGSRRRRA